MKGSPMNRNFGIGSPAKHRTGKTAHDSAHDGTHPTADKFIDDDHNTTTTIANKKAAEKEKAEKSSSFRQTYDDSNTDERVYDINQDKYDAWRKGKDAPDVRYVGQQKNKKHLEDYLKHKESLPKGKGQTNRERILQDKIDFQKKKSPAKQTTSDKVKRPNLYDGKPKNGKPDSYNGPRSKGGVIKTTNYKPKGPRDGMKVTETKKYGKSKGEHTKSKSPAKCPLLAMAPAAIAAVGAMKKNKEE